MFCAEGAWYSLDCDAAFNGAFCGENSEDHSVDCYESFEFESDGEATECDAEHEGVALCQSESHALFCVEGSWYELDCGEVAEGAVCQEADASHVVDCAAPGDELSLE